MSADREHVFTDPDGCQAVIKPSADREHTAYLATGGDDIAVPAHRLAEFTRALWAAAGQPVPDLPVIHDPAQVEQLARDLLYAVEGTHGGAGTARYEDKARTLLSLGWRKP